MDNKFYNPLCFLALAAFAFCSCTTNNDNSIAQLTKNKKSMLSCSEACKATNKEAGLFCKLGSEELQARKETVIESLRTQILETKELKNGYAFKFTGSDEVVDELTEFIKTERECCSFFIFSLSISGDKSEAWLELSGPEGSKDFIAGELDFI